MSKSISTMSTGKLSGSLALEEGQNGQPSILSQSDRTVSSSLSTLKSSGKEYHERLSSPLASSSGGSFLSPTAVIAPEVTLLETSRKVEQKKKIDATIGSMRSSQLDFESVGLVGRDAEVDVLMKRLQHKIKTRIDDETEITGEVYDETTLEINELITISGISGCGKTRLAKSLESPARKLGGVFVHAKCNAGTTTTKPYSALADACQDLCQEVIRRWKENKRKLSNSSTCGLSDDDLRGSLRMKVLETIDGPQIELLQSMVPNLALLMLESPELDNIDYHVDHQGNKKHETQSPHHPKGQNIEDLHNKRRRRESRRLATATLRGNDRAGGGTSTDEGSVASEGLIQQRESGNKAVIDDSFVYLLRILVAQFTGPTVILLDDLQWADQSTLDLAQRMIYDCRFKRKIVVLGTYRSDEVETGCQDTRHKHPLVQFLEEARIKCSGCGEMAPFAMTEIPLEGLSIDAIDLILRHALSINISDEKQLVQTKDLADIVLKRTGGNAYFIRIFIMSLREKELLEFNVGKFCWVWNTEMIDNETVATENLVSLLQNKIRSALTGYDKNDGSRDMISMLQIASCLGHSFQVETLQLVIMHLNTRLMTASLSEHLQTLLDVAEKEKFLEIVDDGWAYRFVHDKVSEAVLDLIPEQDIQSLRFDIGKCLIDHLSPDEIEESLFVVTNLVNAGIGTDLNKLLAVEIAALNCRAAETANMCAAFNSSLSFVASGLLVLKSNDTLEEAWSRHSSLCVRLFTAGAVAAGSTGDIDKSKFFCSTVLARNDLSPMDKIQTKHIQIERLFSDGEYKAAVDESLDILQTLGVNFPRNSLSQRLKAGLYYRETMAKYLLSTEEIDHLPFITDPEKREAYKLMVRLIGFLFNCDLGHLHSLVSCRCIRWAKRYGLSEQTGSAFASFSGVVMHKFGDWKNADRLAKHAVAVQDRLKSNYTKCSTLHKTNTGVLCWTTPLKSCSGRYMEAYRLGMLSGNVEGAAVACWYVSLADFLSGSALQRVETDLHRFSNQLQQLKLEIYAMGIQICLGEITYLNGNSECKPRWVSEERKGMERFRLIHDVHFCHLCSYLGEYKEGADLAMELGDALNRTHPGFFFGFETFSRGICLYATARITKAKTYSKEARKVRAQIRNWVKSGGCNLIHQLQILDAEDAALRGDRIEAKQSFQTAIRSAVRGGFRHNAALANERYAAYLLESDEVEESQFYIREARKLYNEWGAQRIVRRIDQVIAAS